MIYEISRQVESYMRSKGYPYRVHFGPEFPGRDHPGSNGVVMQRSQDRSDRFGAAQGNARNPKYLVQRGMAGDAFVYARSSLPGAARQDHERECESVIDMVTAGLYSTTRQKPLTLDGGRYLTSKEIAALTKIEQWNGAVYLLQFTVARGVTDHAYDGSGDPTGQITGFENVTNAVLVGGSGAGVACGEA